MNINKFASNHGLRAELELGRFPLSLSTDLKTVKYWHRLENMTMSNDSYSILYQAFIVCKNEKHDWYNDITSILGKNGLSYIKDNYNILSSDSVINKLKSKLENQYIQIWDSKSNICDKLKLLNILKKNNYKRSVYLSENSRY